MHNILIPLLTVLVLLTACGGKPEPDPTQTDSPPQSTAAAPPTDAPPTPQPTDTSIPEPTTIEPTAVDEGQDATPIELPDFSGEPLPGDRGQFFAGSGRCSICHTGMMDESVEDISIDSYWRSTMMANAARDPYWQATVRSETLSNPGLEGVIEDKCSTCHMPMARTTLAADSQVSLMLDDGLLDETHLLHNLAMDGVSCTLCHQIEPDNLGEEDSFSGGFLIDTQTQMGERLNYGPYAVKPPMARIMQASSGFIPQQGTHIQESDLCAACHTLHTPTIDRNGEITGIFPEQMTYLEWHNSGYAQQKSCQDCHMPEADGGVVLSITGGQPRSPFSKHAFVGGNTYSLGILRAFGPEIGVTSSSEQFDATIARVIDQLQNRTADVSILSTEMDGGKLIVNVQVNNLTGHKFPTGYPSRRAWLHLTVLDETDEVVFESGAWSQDGHITGNDNDADGTTYEPHYNVINDPEMVQIYEAIFADGNGSVTTELLRGSGYLKDNRLLPMGFDMNTDNDDIGIKGDALTDEDFTDGSDIIRYEIDTGDAGGPFTVNVELLYQPISYRWAMNLDRHQAAEIQRFLEYYDALPNLPQVIGQASAEH
jgi:hypothetical protein